MKWDIDRSRVRLLAFTFAMGFGFFFATAVPASAQYRAVQDRAVQDRGNPYQQPRHQQTQPQYQQTQLKQTQPLRFQEREPYRVAERRTLASRSGVQAAQPAGNVAKPAEDFLKRRPNEHPLKPTLRWAVTGLHSIEQMHGYTARVAKRERVGDKVGDFEYMYIKVRHRPFSVYMYFLGPPKIKGQEVIYIEGANDGKMWAHATGVRGLVGTVQLKPTSPLAMSGQRYPITELGIQNLVRRLLEVGEKDTKYGECDVSFFEGAKVNGRSCTCIQVVHPVPRRNFLFHIAQIYVDDELNIPIRYEAHDWPKGKDGKPELIEEYTYRDFTPDARLSDADFDWRNPNYNFISK